MSRQQFLGRFGIALLDGRHDPGDVAHVQDFSWGERGMHGPQLQSP